MKEERAARPRTPWLGRGLGRRAATVGCFVSLGCLGFAAPALGMGEPSLVRNIGPGPDNGGIHTLAPFDGRLFFAANDGVSGSELWRSDGTEAGTTLFKDINLGPGSSFPMGMTDAFGELIFRATDGVWGEEPWASDGTPEGTGLVTDVNLGPVGSSGDTLTLAETKTYFRATDGTGYGLWVYEGAPGETTLVKRFGSLPAGIQGPMVTVGDTVYFGADDGTGLKLWRSDGTALGTEAVSSDVFTDLTPHVWADGKLFFSATTGPAGYEPWVYDSVEETTTMLKDIVPGVEWGLPLSVSAAKVGGTVLFTATQGSGTELWKTDGTPAGTVPVEDGVRTYGALTIVDGIAYFAGGDGTGTHGFELWRSDGTEVGTSMVADIDEGPDASFPEQLTAIDDLLFFSGNDGDHGYEPWVSDGTEAGTRMVADVYEGDAESSSPEQFTQVGNDVFFVAETEGEGRELWTFELDASPVAVGDSMMVMEDAPAAAVDVLANDTDSDGGPKSIGAVAQPANGTVVITGGGTGLTYEPDPDYCNAGGTPDTFAYQLSPGGDVALVRVTVTCIDDLPIAIDDLASVSEDAPTTAIDVLGNDTDPDGDPFSVGSVTQPANGTVVLTGGGLSYRPDANYCNDGAPADVFTYALSPGGDTATVAVRVSCVADPGTAVAARSANVKKGAARLRLRCRGESRCKGRVVLTVKARRGERTVRVVVGAKRFSIAAGKAKTLRIRLNRAGRKRLAKASSKRLRVQLRGRGVDPRVVVLKKKAG